MHTASFVCIYYCTSESQQKLVQLEDAAKSAGLGKWGPDPPTSHVREITWGLEEPRKLVDSSHGKPRKGKIDMMYYDDWLTMIVFYGI